MNEALEKLFDALSFALFIVIVIVSIVMCAPANAATPKITGGDYVVTVVGDPKPVAQSNQADAKNYALKRWNQCFCDVQINQPVIKYAGLSSSSKSSASSSSKSSISSQSSSSASSVVSLPTVTATCSKKRMNGNELVFEEIGGYDLSCDGRHERFTQESCQVNYVTSLPLLTKNCELATYDKAGVYSDYVVVAR